MTRGNGIGKIENLGRQIAALSVDELVKFRRWFAEFDAQARDKQLETDAKAGRLDALADKAVRALAEGRITRL